MTDTATAKRPVKTGQKQVDAQFKPGQSGNPRGRPPGARNKATLAAEALFEARLESLVGTVVEKALGGDMTAARLVLDRLMPAGKIAKVSFTLPDMATLSDVADAGNALMQAVAAGEIAPDEAAHVQRLLKGHAEMLAAARAAEGEPEVEVVINDFAERRHLARPAAASPEASATAAPLPDAPRPAPAEMPRRILVDAPVGMTDAHIARWLRETAGLVVGPADTIQRNRPTIHPALVSVERHGRQAD
jgi:hypothetical protein